MSIHDDYPTSPPIDDWAGASDGRPRVAAYLGIRISTVYDWRVHGKGPTAYRFGKT